MLLTDDETKDRIARRFAQPGLTFEGLRLKQASAYAETYRPRLQWLLDYLRRVGGSWRINTEAMDSHIWEVWAENSWKFRLGIWIPAALAILLLRTFPCARKFLVRMQNRFMPEPNLYADLFEKYKPDLVIASTAGWRLDRYLLREAKQRGMPTMAAIVGWDNPSSYAIPGAEMDWATCWSELQKEELVRGSDWKPERVNIGGIPSYDGYFAKRWLLPKDRVFQTARAGPRAQTDLLCMLLRALRAELSKRRSAGETGVVRRAVRAVATAGPLASQPFSGQAKDVRRGTGDASTRWRRNIHTCMWCAPWPWAAHWVITAAKTWMRNRP